MEIPDIPVRTNRPKVILFDVYGTLLDMGELQRRLRQLLGNKRAFVIWYNLLLQYSWMDNCTGQYHNFDTVADLAMDEAANIFGEQLNASQKESVLRLMRQLPVHEDVQRGLSRLRDEGYHLSTFTNESAAVVTERMQRTGLISYFDTILSGENVKKHKPAMETYAFAAQSLGVKAHEVLMVSSHGWDVAGALNAGMSAAFIGRKGQSLYPLAPQPDYNVKDLVLLAGVLKKA